MSNVRYLLAKHIPDLQRFEPRNIGVIAWTADRVCARFIAERPERPGDVNGRRIPAFIRSQSAYRQWVRYWVDQLAQEHVNVGGAEVSRSSEQFLDALIESSQGDFALTDGGVVLDDAAYDALPAVTEYLYTNLVDPTVTLALAEEATNRDATLDDKLKELIEAAHLLDDPHFKRGLHIPCPVGNVTETFEFSFAYENGSLQRLYQKVPLSKVRLTLRKTVHDCAWMFSQVLKAQILPDASLGAALVVVPEEQRDEPDIVKSIAVLGTVTRVIDLARHEADVLTEFRSLHAAH